MSSETVLSVRDLGKCYRIFSQPQDRLKQALWRGRKKFYREFWALKNVSFDVRRGETVGIVGRNGSGKSTLLQLICGTLTPTAGEVRIHGRIAALLELGSGFNPEFTGRENVYLNASMLGLSRDEIDARYNSIAAFADIGEFIDRPVKTYSSGMYVRLAFAVAVSVDPDIFIVDEALSVGDEAFQRKCFSRIEQLREGGATILFVSHSASTIVQLCNRAVLFDAGEQLLTGSPKWVVSRYHKLIYAPPHRADSVRAEIRASSLIADVATEPDDEPSAPPAGRAAVAAAESGGIAPFYDPELLPKSTLVYESRGARIQDPHITDLQGRRVNNLIGGDEYVYNYAVRFEDAAFKVRFGMLIKTVSGFELGGAASSSAEDGVDIVSAGAAAKARFRFRCCFTPGVYFMNAGVLGIIDGAETYLDRRIDAAMFRVMPVSAQTATGLVDIGAVPEVHILEDSITTRE
jgi:lipopolysaccharide transport system ATP-binding protein